MHQHDAFNWCHPRLIPHLARQVAGIKDTVRVVRTDLVLCRNQCFKLCNLNRLLTLRCTQLPRLNFCEHLVVRKAVKGLLHRGLLLFIPKLVNFLHGLQVIPNAVHCLFDRLVTIRERDHAHELREVGVGGRTDQQPARLPAGLLGENTQPWACAIARSKRSVSENGRLCHAAFRLSALTSNPHFGQVSARTPFVYEELAYLLGAVGRPIVGEGVPVNVANVACTAGAYKPNRHHGTLFLVPIDELSSGQRLLVNQQSGMVIQRILRHANVSTTATYYIKTAAADVRSAMTKLENHIAEAGQARTDTIGTLEGLLGSGPSTIQ